MKKQFFDDAGRRLDLKGAAQQIETPTCILWGGADNVISAKTLGDLNQSFTKRVFPKVGHMPHLEAVKDVVEAIGSHIENSRQ